MTDTTPLLRVEDLRVAIDGKPILRGVSLEVRRGEVHALMGPNGSGKSTLANTLMGHPRYQVTSGQVRFNGEDVTRLTADKRAKRGMFLAFQYPVAIPGVSLGNFLRSAVKAARGDGMSAMDFRKQLRANMELLKMDPSFAGRYTNEGFSGGEKKRAEVLQMAMLRPELAIMDETDSGLDIDALRVVAEGVNALKQARPEMAVLIITHYQRILNYITPDVVHVLVAGRVVESGGAELVQRLEAEGYEPFLAADRRAGESEFAVGVSTNGR
ncbi:MAG TPA: Fe-S cluster assembly ATPase SufC [Myxococcales bacterium]|nr:Fe-S cluster assembly ATPase SufC [Myxococcales bacterium]